MLNEADFIRFSSDADNIFIATVKMHLYYMNPSIDKDRMIAKQKNELNDKMKPLTTTIINCRLKSKKECDEYVKKIAVDIIAHYSLGPPSTEVCIFLISCSIR